jgi:ubiquinone/menaquinone biosynthesis C-methylase UbiE
MNSNRPGYEAARSYFGKRAQQYDLQRASKPLWSSEQEIVGNYIRSLPSYWTVLDVPFGSGRFVPFYREREMPVTGVDISKDMLEAARCKFGSDEHITMLAAPAEALPFSDLSFDALICHRFVKWLPTLDHVRAVLREFDRVTRTEMLVQVKLTDRTPLNSRFKSLTRKLLRKRRDRETTCYSLTDLLPVMEQNGWRSADVVSAPHAGPGVAYIFLRRCE